MPLPLTTAPMEAKLVAALPDGDGWQYEPKWDGFRCVAFRDGGDVALMSKSGKPLQRFFPEIEALVARLAADRFVLDGEVIVTIDGALAFDALQARLHPAASRIAKLSRETPAQFIVFDCLAAGGQDLTAEPLSSRREALETLMAGEDDPMLQLSPMTRDATAASAWLATSGGALDGIVAKRRDDPYGSGERAMLKLKPSRTADCVVGGFRYASGSKQVGSLLLGLYDAAGQLDHVGFTSGIKDVDRVALTERLEVLVEAPGFTGKAPGGPSRWNTERSAEWQPLRPELVVEVTYDQVTSGRFRHGTGFVRWRPDKAPHQCDIAQLAPPLRPAEVAAIVARA
ncbi:ATP-dependent DNA ligase [Polymorphobacter megasporae]|uniref:ATP-dependent DNA ligase n=1 Tax=Glacieibacterium megasporae TaxID=2835787 RepID=UPI002103D6EF|nr:ATP-dependent DNA ligase [Polymorphobacter megasporae]